MSSEHDDARSGGGTASPAPHPGAAFGIPAGASGEEVVDAVFGDGRRRPGGAGGAGARTGSDEDPNAGIDPELLPYLEAAGQPGSVRSGVSVAQVRQAAADDDERRALREEADLAALRELIAANMLPDGSLEELDALLSDIDQDDSDDWDSWEPQLPDAPGGAGMEGPGGGTGDHRCDLEAAARSVEISQRMRQVEEEILSRAPEHRIQPSLSRVEAVLELLGNPERTYRVIHITGTNGKTSTARMADGLLAAAGLRTGRFTSPHLATIRERISLDGQPVSEEAFIAAWEDVSPYIAMVDEASLARGGPRLSFFEVLTVMALAAFADHPVDVAVIEVGLGGTWDSTNVVVPEVAVITPIGRDHQMWLGETIEDIARNKAGIIKEGATVVTAVQPVGAEAVIEEAVASCGAVWRRELDPQEDPQAPGAGQLRVVDRQIGVGGQLVTLATAAAVYEDVFVPLHGQYQAHNALLALAAVEAVFAGRPLPAQVVQDGFASATSPGRLEVLRSSPTVIVDAAHNPHGVGALLPAIEEVFGLRHMVAVIGLMADKDAEGILSVLEPATDAVVVVPIDSPRAMDPEELAALAREVYGDDRVHTADDLGAAIEEAARLSEGFDAPMTASGVLVVGSVLLAARARSLFGRS